MRPASTLVLGAAAFAMATIGLVARAQERQRSAPEMFAHSCIYCHDAGGWGTRSLERRAPPGEAELLERKDLPAGYTRMVVRRGIGAMPPLTPTDLTDDELDRLARWLDEKN